MNKIFTSFFFLTNLISVLPKPLIKESVTATCQACHPIDVEKINVHIIPHSHDDVGWLKTVDQYYYGSEKHIQYAGVQYIISSSIESLKGHPNRRYIQVESAFFWKWWQNQDEALKEIVRELVNNGQLEIINGAWSMNDEAASNYQSTIDQFTWGFRFLGENFGNCGRPKVGWQIDPFGHSREHASLLTQLGFQGLVIGRLDYRDKNKRREEQNLDFIWKSSANLNNSELFTTMFPDFYGTLDGYCFDVLCNYEPIIDDKKSPDYNLKEKVDGFAQKLDKYKSYYQTTQFLVPMGGDFNYQAAEINFSNLDKLIKGFDGHPVYNIFYSTPSCYIKAVNDELIQKSLNLTTKSDDFFPYASEKHAYWTGYFTSRPTSKRFERLGNNILQATKQLTTFSKSMGEDGESFITELREVMGIMQHHDAITGTEKQAVANDYARLLTRAIKTAEEPIGKIFGKILQKNTDIDYSLPLTSCLLSNISICEVSTEDKFLVTVYNPLSRPVTHYVRLPVNDNFFKISGPDGEEEYDIFESISTFDYVKEKVAPSKNNLVFAAKDIPPLGTKMYYVEKLENKSTDENKYQDLSKNDTFGTENSGFTLDFPSGKLNRVVINGVWLNVSQNFYHYLGSSGGGGRPSGAYVFRPKEQSAKVMADQVTVKVKKGKLVDEVHQVFNSEVTQIIRAYKGKENFIEFDWLVGDLQTDHSTGKEIITRFVVNDFKNKGIFYTDSNGREQIKRELNKRSDYEYDASEEPVTSNYYPITSKIVIKDEENNLEVAVLNDRAQGGTSLSDGQIELMVHRKLVRDDGFGVGEVLSEKEYGKGLFARGSHYLTFGAIKPTADGKSTAASERDLTHRNLLAPIVFLAKATEELDTLEKVQNLFNFEFSGLTRALPENVKILTLEPWRDNTFLLRLEHVLEKDEDPILSQPIIINLEDLFTLFMISEIGETTLGANQWLDDYELEEKLIWNKKLPTPLMKLNEKDPLKIELRPMQIRTFVIQTEV